MRSQESENYEKLRDAFEGREAIYIDKRVLRVRVTNIRCTVSSRYIRADVEEVPTPNLAGGIPHSDQPGPHRWRIGAGFLTTFSENRWDMGYGGWSLFFAAEVLNGLTNLAADWPADLDARERYRRAIARRQDCDDVLFVSVGEPLVVAVVHLTCANRREPDPRWPYATFFDSMQDWIERAMRPDHEDFTS